MGYFAEIENGIVKRVISISNETLGEPENAYPQTETIGQTFIKDVLQLEGEWIQTSFNASFRGTYAGIGYTYDRVRDIFIAPLVETIPNEKPLQE